MNHWRTISGLVAIAIAASGVQTLSVAATGPIETNSLSPIRQAPEEPAREPVVPAVPVSRGHPQTGNPLWALPLRSLTATRERPLFSPSRRPPLPPAVAAAYVPTAIAPPKPVEPGHPSLILLGTIVGDSQGIGIFLDAANTVVRLKTGEDHDGWILRRVRGREASFEKGERTATLALPAPGAQPTIQAAAGLPGPIGAPGSGAWLDGDGQLIAPPPSRTSLSRSR
jgi:hypothetical protein